MATFLNLIPRLKRFEERVAELFQRQVTLDVDVASQEYEKLQELYDLLEMVNNRANGRDKLFFRRLTQ